MKKNLLHFPPPFQKSNGHSPSFPFRCGLEFFGFFKRVTSRLPSKLIDLTVLFSFKKTVDALMKAEGSALVMSATEKPAIVKMDYMTFTLIFMNVLARIGAPVTHKFHYSFANRGQRIERSIASTMFSRLQ